MQRSYSLSFRPAAGDAQRQRGYLLQFQRPRGKASRALSYEPIPTLGSEQLPGHSLAERERQLRARCYEGAVYATQAFRRSAEIPLATIAAKGLGRPASIASPLLVASWWQALRATLLAPPLGVQGPARPAVIRSGDSMAEAISERIAALSGMLTGTGDTRAAVTISDGAEASRGSQEAQFDEVALRAVREAVAAEVLEALDQAERGTLDAVFVALLEDHRAERFRHDADLVERIVTAVSGQREMTITDILQAIKHDFKTAIIHEAWAAGDRGDASAVILEAAADWAENHDALNRPAGVFVPDIPAEWLDGIHDDIWEAYRDGLDLMKLPGKDFDYEARPSATAVVDANGIPYAPYGPINQSLVEVYGSDLISQHPIPQYAQVGNFVILVDTYVLTDTMLFIHHWKRKDAFRYAGMTLQQAVFDMLDKLHAYVESMVGTERYLEYQRAFRHVRWYAESVLNRYTVKSIRRTYDRWQSKESDGKAGAPAHLENVMIHGGLFQNTAATCKAEFYLRNYVDGELQLNARVASAAGSLTVSVDDHSVTTVGTGTHLDITVPVPMGEHAITITGQGELAWSYMRLSGYEFISYEVLPAEQSEMTGQAALALLVQMLLKYYQDHHTNKTKGDRERWILS